MIACRRSVMLFLRLLFGVVLAVGLLAAVGEATEHVCYVGTYTRGTASQGIYVCRFDDSTGALTQTSVAQGVENPSFLALHPTGNFLYSADETDDFADQPSGAVTALAVARPTGGLTLLNRQSAGGSSPCHLTVAPAGKQVLVVGYGSGTVAVLPLAADGRVEPVSQRIEHHGASVDPDRQTAPHPHQIVLDRAGEHAFVPDLGLDQVVQYRFDERTGKLTPNEPPALATAPGAGPRHLAFHPNGRYAYLINEISLTIDLLAYDSHTGTLTHRATVSTLAANTPRAGLSGAEIAVHPNGKFVYASLRGCDEIVAYAVDESTGKLSLLERESTRGRTPRNFAIDPTGGWLLAANQNSGDIATFRITADGRLEPIGTPTPIPAPVCVLFLGK